MSETMQSQPQVDSPTHEPLSPSRPPARPAAAETRTADPAEGGGLDETRLHALTGAVSKLARDYGRTPSRVTSWVVEAGCVVTALEGFMTPAEHRLVARGRSELVERVRRRFGEAITDRYVRAAEGALGCRVLSHHSTVICASSVCLEIFLLPGAPLHSPLPVRAPVSERTSR